MVARLANVIYWAACALACLCFLAAAGAGVVAAGIFGSPVPELNSWAVLAGIVGALIWLSGKAIKYVLVGNK